MRAKEIDTVRGIGIFAIILIHVCAWYTSDSTARFIWNYSQFAVPAFVFCSTYLFYLKRDSYAKEGFINYSLKRIKRLIFPYWIYLLFFFLIFVVKNQVLTAKDIFLHLTLATPGNELNWAVLLFIYISLLMFPLNYLWKKNKPLFALFSLFSFLSSLVMPLHLHYKLTMWLPWSLIIVFSWLFAKYENRKYFYPTTLLLLVTCFLFLQTSASNTLLISNKYPPNLYFLSYGMLITTALYYLAKKGVFRSLEKGINYLSVNSYPIFFIHLWLVIASINFLNIKVFTWWEFLAGVFALTVIINEMRVKFFKIGLY